jgi:hypothetical protein
MSSINVADGPARAAVVQNAGYRWAFNFLASALLVDVAWRSFFRAEAAWDLLALVVATGAFAGGYQACQGTLSRSRIGLALLAACLAAFVAALIALVR